MATPSDMNWGHYSSYEGVYYWGKRRWKLPADHGVLDEYVFVMSSSEGCLDAMNLVDRCILSGGAIGWCDAYPQLSYTKLLGSVAEKHHDPTYLQRTLKPALDASGASFKKNASGQWRFFIGSQEVNTQELQRKLYFAGSSGKTGDWTGAQKAHAKLWAACCATVFEDADAQRIQIEYTKPKMMGFVTAYAKEVLFDDGDPKLAGADMRLVKALRAVYVSFAGNNPTWANAAIKNASVRSRHDKWSRAWCIDVMHDLTFLKGIKIYPDRYAKVAAVVDALYGIDLPKTAAGLREASSVPPPSAPVVIPPTPPPPAAPEPTVDAAPPDVTTMDGDASGAEDGVATIGPATVNDEPTSNDETAATGDPAKKTAIEPVGKPKPKTALDYVFSVLFGVMKLLIELFKRR